MATQCFSISSSKTSTGFRQLSVLRGLPFNSAATLSSSSWVCKDRSVPFGKYLRSSPLVFSLVPRCHGLCGSQKKNSGIDLEASVLRHLGPLVPGERPAQLFGQGDDGTRDRIATASAPCPASAGPLRGPSP